MFHESIFCVAFGVRVCSLVDLIMCLGIRDQKSRKLFILMKYNLFVLILKLISWIHRTLNCQHRKNLIKKKEKEKENTGWRGEAKSSISKFTHYMVEGTGPEAGSADSPPFAAGLTKISGFVLFIFSPEPSH